jgi:putative transposase
VTRTLIEPAHPQLSVARQCALLGVARSSWYYTPHGERAENLELMRSMDEQYTQTPFYGIRRAPDRVRRGRRLSREAVRSRDGSLIGVATNYNTPV